MGIRYWEGTTMFGLYLATAIVGWAFVALFLFGGTDAEAAADFEVDGDTDLDADLDGDLDLSGGGLASAVASVGLSLLSFRSIMFFLAFFGLTGIVLGLVDAGTLATLLAAIAVGTFAWAFNSFVFRALKVSDVSSNLRREDLQGALGRVVHPISAGHRGRIAVEVGDQRRYLTAEPFDPNKQTAYAVGDQIVIVELNKGTARVAPLNVLDS